MSRSQLAIRQGGDRARGFLREPGGTESPMRRSQAQEPWGLFGIQDHSNKWRVTGPPSEARAASLMGSKVVAFLALPLPRSHPEALPALSMAQGTGDSAMQTQSKGFRIAAVSGESSVQFHSSFLVEEGAQRRRPLESYGERVSQLEGGSWKRDGHHRLGQRSQGPLTSRPQPFPNAPLRGYPVLHPLSLALLLLMLAASSHQGESPVRAEREQLSSCWY